MCGRMSLSVPGSVLAERFGAEFAGPPTPRYNIAPGDDVAAIRDDAPDAIQGLEWGLLPGWVDDPDGYPKPINARAETVAEKPSFREAFAERRCLVLADGFYEWKGERGSKRPYRVERADGEPFAMAGLWERWSGDGGERETATVITTEPNGVVGGLHDRMPVVLAPDEEREWLRAAGDRAHDLLDPAPDEWFQAYPVSTAVNDPENDGPEVVEERPDPQSGLDEFP